MNIKPKEAKEFFLKNTHEDKIEGIDKSESFFNEI